MPLSFQAPALISLNFEGILHSLRVSLITIGRFTPAQFADFNAHRSSHRLHALECNEIVFLGRHIYGSRIAKDGYGINDVLAQIEAALADTSVVYVGERMSALHSTVGRSDGYGDVVRN